MLRKCTLLCARPRPTPLYEQGLIRREEHPQAVLWFTGYILALLHAVYRRTIGAGTLLPPPMQWPLYSPSGLQTPQSHDG